MTRGAAPGRLAALVLSLALGACDRAPSEAPAPAAPPPLAFDGAAAAGEPAKRAHGERLAAVLGCRGCHGDTLEGEPFYEVYASNLTREIRRYDRSAFARVLREGVRKGPPMWAMPSDMFQHLADPDIDALYAYLTSLPAAGKPTPPPAAFSAKTKKEIAEGKKKPVTEYVRLAKDAPPLDLGPGRALGRYVAMTSCTECHAPDLKGWDGDTPDLVVAGTYSREEFEKLITEGVPTGGRKLKPLMVGVAKSRFSKLTPRERDALYAYLKARAEAPQ